MALAATPLIVFALSLLTGLVCYGIISLKYSGTPFSAMASWNAVTLLKAIYTIFVDLLVGSLWYLPLAAFVLMVSGWAKRAVSLWVALPPLVIVIAESWWLNTNHFARFLAYRSFGLFSMMGIGEKKEIHLNAGASSEGAGHITAMLDKLDLTHVLLNIDLWRGAIAAAAMVLVAIRVRRYRDDTSG